MSLNVYLECPTCAVYQFSRDITHNLGAMAREAGLYMALWRPEEIGIETGAQLVDLLRAGIAQLVADPDRFRALNPPNGWGTYEGLLDFARAYLAACEDHPAMRVRASR